MDGIIIRNAGAQDAPAISTIINREIMEDVNVWDESPRPPDMIAAWIAERQGAGYAVLVAMEGAQTLGYGALGPFRPHSGYKSTVEHSIYVAPAARRRGVGRALLLALIERAQADGFHAMIGGVEAGNAASLSLHAASGFEETARMPEVGRKFDRWLTLVLMQRTL